MGSHAFLRRGVVVSKQNTKYILSWLIIYIYVCMLYLVGFVDVYVMSVFSESQRDSQ